MTFFKNKKIPPDRIFSNYSANFESDPLHKSVGLRGINPLSWKQFGPIISGSSGYVEYLQEPTTGSSSGYNTDIKPIGFGFKFGDTTYTNFIASPHGWMALLDPNSTLTTNLDTIYNNRFLASGSFVNSAITQSFSNNDILLAPWFDRLMMTHRDLESFVTFFSGSNAELASQKENFLYGKINSKSQPFNEFDYGMKYVVVNDSVDGKALVVRWSSMGYEYRGFKLNFETVLYENGKIEFNYAPLDYYSTQYTLLGLSSDPTNVWKLDESSGSTVDDAMDNDNITYKTPSNMCLASGKIETASFFSGSNSTVIYANDNSFANYSVTNTFSFSAWFKSALNDSNNKPIVARMDTSFAKGYILYLEGGYISVKISQTFAGQVLQLRSSLNTYNDAQWHHVVMTYDGSATAAGVKIYVDGDLISMTTVASTLTTSSDIQASGIRFCIGANGNQSTTQYNFSGTIDDVARWNSVINASDANLIYENGLLGISAADIQVIGDSTTSYATCGIFASGSSNWNYRDFAPLLGLKPASRSYSSLGGALYTSSYAEVDSETSTSSSYSVSLGINNWPKHGGKIIFSPPKLRRRLILSDAHENERRQFFTKKPFDDRRIINYVTQSNVDVSTILPQSSIIDPSYPGVHLKQNLISSDGIKIDNRKIISSGYAAYAEDETENIEKIEPFSEVFLPELYYYTSREQFNFYVTGTIPTLFGERPNSFYSRVPDKKSITLSFPVSKKIKMLTSASSIYYFNFSSKQWEIPTSSIADHTSSSFSKLSAKTIGLGIGGSSYGSFFLEDKIGFDSFGNPIASGSLNIFRDAGSNRNQSVNEFGKTFNMSQHLDLLSNAYDKSIQRNASYNASEQEIFSLPIDEPYLIEKAVVELPFCFGTSWFNDKTTFLIASASNFAHTASGGATTSLPSFTYFDEGGPAITVALYCQKTYGTGSVRDLIFNSSFTHQDDTSTSIDFVSTLSGTLSQTWNAIITGGNSKNLNIDESTDVVKYITSGDKKLFTGSVRVSAIPSVKNCAYIAAYKSFVMSSYENSGSMLLDFDNFMSSEFTAIDDAISSSVLIGLDPFGRSMGGWSAGEELNTTQGIVFGNSSIRNPFFISGSSERQQITGSLEQKFNLMSSGSFLYCVSKVPLGRPKVSPYLVNPGDKLILAVSKTRPSYRSVDIRLNDSSLVTGKIANVVSSSYFCNILNQEGHDVYLNTGTINIKLYGSNIRLNQENKPV